MLQQRQNQLAHLTQNRREERKYDGIEQQQEQHKMNLVNDLNTQNITKMRAHLHHNDRVGTMMNM